MKLYEMNPDERDKLGKKARDYVQSEFSYGKTIDLWHETLTDLCDNWKKNFKPWECKTF